MLTSWSPTISFFSRSWEMILVRLEWYWIRYFLKNSILVPWNESCLFSCTAKAFFFFLHFQISMSHFRRELNICLLVRLQVSDVIPKVLFYIPYLLLCSPSTAPASLLARRKHSFNSCSVFVVGKHWSSSCSVTYDTKGVCMFFLKQLPAWK